MTWRASHHGIASGLAIMDVQTVNDNISDKLDSDASSISNVDISPTAINGLEAVHDQLLLQLDNHVPLEHNPQRFFLDDSVAQSSGPGVDRVIITRVGDDIETAVTATNRIPAKTNATVCKALAVLLPLGVTTPAVINGIASSA